LRNEFLNETQTLENIRAQRHRQRRGQTLAQMALAWVLRGGRVTSALIGASRPEQVDDCVGALANRDFSTRNSPRSTLCREADINLWAASAERKGPDGRRSIARHSRAGSLRWRRSAIRSCAASIRNPIPARTPIRRSAAWAGLLHRHLDLRMVSGRPDPSFDRPGELALVKRPLERASQLDMRGNPDSGGIWAPCLSHADGLFWLVYTDVKRLDGNFKDTHNYIVTAPTIEGPWSDPVLRQFERLRPVAVPRRRRPQMVPQHGLEPCFAAASAAGRSTRPSPASCCRNTIRRRRSSSGR
jgi:hypothetical protein